MDEQLYEIQDGVRRAKATWLCGYETISAQIGDDAQIVELPLRRLRSPKILSTRQAREEPTGA